MLKLLHTKLPARQEIALTIADHIDTTGQVDKMRDHITTICPIYRHGVRSLHMGSQSSAERSQCFSVGLPNHPEILGVLKCVL